MMNNQSTKKSGPVKIHVRDLDLLVEASGGTHPLAAHHMAREFQKEFGEPLDLRIQNLNHIRETDETRGAFVEDAIIREIESIARQVVHSTHHLFGVASHHRLSFSFSKKVGESVYVANTGRHHLYVFDAASGQILDLNTTDDGLTNQSFSGINKREQAMKSGDVFVYCLRVDPKDLILILGEDAAQHLSIDLIKRLMENTDSSEVFEQEMQLHAHVARRESDFDSDQDIAVLVVEIH